MTAGVSAALLAGAGVAGADSGAGTESSGSSTSDSKASDSKGSDAPKARPKPAAESNTTTPDATKPDTTKPDGPSSETPSGTEVDTPPSGATDSETPKSEPGPAVSASPDQADRPAKHSTAATSTSQKKPQVVEAEATTETSPPVAASTNSASTEESAEPVTKPAVTQSLSTNSVAPVSLVRMTAAAASIAAPQPPSVLGVIQGVITAVVVNVGSLIINTVQAVEALVTGPPVVPPGSTVTVRSSTVQLSNGQRVAANWFYPKTPDGAPPTNMILLQHGFFALGPMYSYTAAHLAETTNSVVVTTTLTSNPFAGDSVWLGGTGTSAAIADLFVGDRAALTASAVDAGYAQAYDFSATPVALPQKFALIGHSLGANLVSGAAGFLVDKGAADDLVGVILLDGVPTGSTLPDALTKLNAYAESTGGHYVPVRQIGAPPNLYNFISTANADLTSARPGRFNGVVLAGGVHSDSMRGGNPLIQLALYLAAGFPQPQNPPAVDELSAQWFNEWFAGNTGEGDCLAPGTGCLTPGTTVDVPTPQGTALGVVIGDPPATTLRDGPIQLASSTPTTIPTANPTMASLAA
ncbi:hypothetical protein [Mycolicibacterium sp.]|uniref:hypothetical protein n=1 Tax=Mycolicibacterium sp. TaxID=2320850 RepID=UPI001A3109F2|nr:hypothetical protein [Mycolicibacterium sp.]MBJ7338091.1 hypothetical protein [Mycolicibacterium sp.]